MLKIDKRLNIENNSSIIKIAPFNPKLVILIDSCYNLYLLNRDLKNIVKELKLTKTDSTLLKNMVDIYDKHIAFIYKSKLFVMSAGAKLNTIRTIDFKHSNLKELKFSNCGKYLALISNSKDILIYDREYYKLIDTIESDIEILNFEFSSDDRFISISYSDNTTDIFDLLTNRKYKSTQTKSPVLKNLFYTNEKSFLITKRLDIKEFYINDEMVEFKANFDLEEINLVEFINHRFIILTDNDKRVIIFDLIKSDIIFQKRYFFNIDSIYTDERYLYLGGENRVDLIDLKHKEDELDMHFMVKNYKAGMECISENILLLLNDKFSNILEKEWSDSFKIILDKIAHEEIESAKELAKVFNKNYEIKKYIQKSYLLKKFKETVSIGNISLAYEFIEENPFLKETIDYNELEKYWMRVLIDGKKFSKKNDYMNTERTFKPFKNIKIKKDLIEAVFRNKGLIEQFDKSAMSRDFKTLFTLIEEHPFLKESDTYKKALINGHTLYQKFLNLFKEREFEKCSKLSKVLIHFKPYQKDIAERLVLIKELQKIETFLKEQNFEAIFEIFNTKEEFIYSEHTLFIVEEIEKLFQEKCRKVLKGEATYSEQDLKNLASFDLFKRKVESILKLSDINLIISNRDSKNDIKHLIENYESKFKRDRFLDNYLIEFNLC